MGTNYYLHIDVCRTCARPEEKLHIGKSSGGWCFALHIIPEEEITSLATWEKIWNQEGNEIYDEYGTPISPQEMKKIITKRSGIKKPTVEFLRENHGAPGPKKLARHRVDGTFCVAHGEGTWDLVIGEFS